MMMVARVISHGLRSSESPEHTRDVELPVMITPICESRDRASYRKRVGACRTGITTLLSPRCLLLLLRVSPFFPAQWDSRHLMAMPSSPLID